MACNADDSWPCRIRYLLWSDREFYWSNEHVNVRVARNTWGMYYIMKIRAVMWRIVQIPSGSKLDSQSSFQLFQIKNVGCWNSNNFIEAAFWDENYWSTKSMDSNIHFETSGIILWVQHPFGESPRSLLLFQNRISPCSLRLYGSQSLHPASTLVCHVQGEGVYGDHACYYICCFVCFIIIIF